MPPPNAVEPGGTVPDPVARFRSDCLALLDAAPASDRPLALAVSGGPDSMAMLVLAHAALRGAVIVATVDHGLRPEARGEAEMVARWCAARGVPHDILTIAARSDDGGNLHARAREARYRLLHDWATAADATALATAHHADDQAETFMMRANRGAGVAGLAAIRARQEVADARTVAVIRPLLGWRRAELRTVAECAGAPFVDDPSNVDPRFERARLRDRIAAADWIDAAAIARAAGHVAEAERDLRAVADWLWAERGGGEGDTLFCDIAAMPRGVRRIAARIGIARMREAQAITAPAFSLATNIEPLLDALECGRAATQGGVLVRPVRTRWTFTPAPPRRSL